MSHPYKTRAGGATVTVFVPYDCANHCPFCINEKCSRFLPEDQRGYYKKKTDTQDGEATQDTEEKPKKAASGKTSAAKKTGAKTAAAKKPAAKKAAAKTTKTGTNTKKRT